MSSIANILLQVTGDSEDGRRALADMSSDLAEFGRETAEATADIDTAKGSVALDELKAKLAEFSADDVSAEVNVQIAKAQADLAVLQAELDHIDGENVDVDVNVRKGLVSDIASLTGQIDRLGQETESVSSGGLSNFASGLSDSFDEAEIFGKSASSLAELLPVLAAVIVAVVGDLAAMVATLISAAGAVGALAVAFGAVLAPAIAIGVGAFLRFKETSGEAGTAANALKEQFGEVGDSFKKATAGGSDALFRGLTDALKDLSPVIKELGPRFTELGKAGADAFRSLGSEFSSPAWRKFFSFATESLTKLTPLFARSFGAFANILRNIATAAMPILIQGFRDVAHWLEGIANKTSDVKGLRETIGHMADSLSAVGHLLGGLTDLVGAFVKAFAPIGDKIVGSLGDGAENLAKWLESSEGLEKVKQFFEDVGPLASELGKLVLNVSLAFIQLGEFVAPALTPIVKGFNDIFGVINKVLTFLNDHVSAGFRAFIGTIAAVVAAFSDGIGEAGALVVALRAIIAIAGVLGGALSGVAKAVGDALSNAVDFAAEIGGKIAHAVASGLSDAASAVTAAAGQVVSEAIAALRARVDIAKTVGAALINAVSTGFKASRDAVLSAAKAIITQAITALRSRVDIARNIGRAIIAAVKGGFNEARGDVVGAARDIVQACLSILRGAIDLGRNIGESIINAVRGGMNAARGAVTDAINAIRTAALNLLRDGIAAAQTAGEAIVQSIARGVSAAASAVYSAVEAIFEKIRSIIEAPLHVHIDVPSVDIPGLASGVRDLGADTLSLVGEKGPELRFLPKGTDIFTANETRRILNALAGGAQSPVVAQAPALAGVGAGGGGSVIQHQEINVSAPKGELPDAEMTVALIAQKIRGRFGT